MKTFAWMMALRYLRSGRRDKALTTMIRICFGGIMLGAFALTLVLCVMAGFERAAREKLQSLNPTVMIRAHEHALNVPVIEHVLCNEFPTVVAYSATIQQFVMIKQAQNKALSTVVTLKAIDPVAEERVTTLARLIIQPRGQTLAQLVYDNRVLIGAKLAKQLQIDCGDSFSILYAPDQEQVRSLEQVTVVVGGLFSTGIEEFDLSMIVADREFAQTLFPEQGVDEIGLRLAAVGDSAATIARLKKRFAPLDVVTWQDLYPALVAALKLEKYAMFFVVLLISLVACMNIISLLFMFITHKRRDIAILKAYGVSNSTIGVLFFLIGTVIGVVGAACGVLLAWLTGLALTAFPLIKLPDVYYATYLPISLDATTFVVVFGTIVLLTMSAALIPLRSIAQVQIADILRFEA